MWLILNRFWTPWTTSLRSRPITSRYIDINNKGTIVLYDSKSIVNYINLNCELRLKAFKKISVVQKNDKNIITIFEYDNLLNIIFRRKRDSTNYLMISTTHLMKSNLNILKKDDDLKKRKLRSYTSIKLTHIIKITLCNKKIITIIHRKYKESYITRIL